MAKEDRIKAWTPTMRDRAQSWAQERLEAAGMSRYKARQLAPAGSRAAAAASSARPTSSRSSAAAWLSKRVLACWTKAASP